MDEKGGYSGWRRNFLLLLLVFSLQSVWYFSTIYDSFWRHVIHLIKFKQPAVTPLSEGLYHNEKLNLPIMVGTYFLHLVRPSACPSVTTSTTF